MNAFIILLLCSVAYCFASPTCSIDQELQKCGTRYPDTINTEEALENYCEDLSCWIDVFERCGSSEDEESRMGYLRYQKAFRAMCDKSNPIREKVVRNLQCISDVSASKESKQCVDDPKFNVESSNHHEFCRVIIEALECNYDLILKSCGRDAKDAFEAANPDAELFGCP